MDGFIPFIAVAVVLVFFALGYILRNRRLREVPTKNIPVADPLVGDDPKKTLTDGSSVTEDHRKIHPGTGLQKAYVVLSAEERAKGFVRPYRDTYVHVGRKLPETLRDLTPEEEKENAKYGYVKYEQYPPDRDPLDGRFWTEMDLEYAKGSCGGVTTMNRALSETYARDPKFYGATFCSKCRLHRPVGQEGEFVWFDTDIRVGTWGRIIEHSQGGRRV